MTTPPLALSTDLRETPGSGTLSQTAASPAGMDGAVSSDPEAGAGPSPSHPRHRHRPAPGAVAEADDSASVGRERTHVQSDTENKHLQKVPATSHLSSALPGGHRRSLSHTLLRGTMLHSHFAVRSQAPNRRDVPRR